MFKFLHHMFILQLFIKYVYIFKLNFLLKIADSLATPIFSENKTYGDFNNIQDLEALYALLFSILSSIIVFVIYVWKYYKKKKIERDMHPFYTNHDLKHYIRNYVPTQIQNTSPSNFDEPNLSDSSIKILAIPFLISKFDSSSRYFIILGDSGTGKTTLLFNLYHQYTKKIYRKYKIKLIPLGDVQCDFEVTNLSSFEKRRTVLLLDAFDEDGRAYENYSKRLESIINMTLEYRKVIITCRTQFFPSEKEEPYETGVLIHSGEKGIMRFEKFYISPFDDIEINKYLVKKYSIFSIVIRGMAKKIVKKTPNLMVRPLLLSYIDDLIGLRNNNYVYEIYKELVKKWIERESNFKKLEDEKLIYKNQLNRFSQQVALDMYKNLINKGSFLISADDINNLIIEYQIPIPSTDAKSRSLLNRNSQGAYKFAHKSIAEYFISQQLFSDFDFRKIFSSDGLDMAILMYQEMKFDKETSHKILKYIKNIRNTKNGSFEIEYPNGVISSEGYLIDQLASKIFDSFKISFISAGLDDIQIFESFPKLKTLILANNKINLIDGMISISLEKLYLNNNGNLTFKNFHFPNLKHLDISNNFINDWGFIQNINKSIEWINLSQTNVSKKIIERIREKCPKCQIALNHEDNYDQYPGYYFIIGPPNSNIKNATNL